MSKYGDTIRRGVVIEALNMYAKTTNSTAITIAEAKAIVMGLPCAAGTVAPYDRSVDHYNWDNEMRNG